MPELSITMDGRHEKVGSIKLSAFSRALPKNVRKAMVFAGATLEEQITINLRKYVGPPPGNRNRSKETGPPASRKFPAFRTGTLWRSVNFQLKGSGSATGVVIGPGGDASAYAAVQEKGSARRNIRPRPYVQPAWKKQRKKVIKGIQRRLNAPLRTAR